MKSLILLSLLEVIKKKEGCRLFTVISIVNFFRGTSGYVESYNVKVTVAVTIQEF